MALLAALPPDIEQRLAPMLTPESRKLDALPTQRRNAITIRYGDTSLDEFSMYNGSLHVPSNRGSAHDSRSDVLRDLILAPTDSWEIDLCIGLVCSLIILPLWE